ncbi:MAG: LPS export ABC transporter ATP-binding protein [Candidatus Omnitrophica bacterium]|nr:LPS export ABC transporter ATP-binding protein [Candidatus Omnitrophota bacterium]MBU1047595.1 LPS export ABC transporter ATP-binding protein [Candidatus Omnitrophota bacterium]MBU1631497.1 LPS export ABC transporter ATP-binding protein [Candidatus Omnitrophota bacterium]MBU1766984.1 LPS export ABC transporter ATP-binding protein [Candidatus Omnitrophota bacterium]MBU1888957.1 LPS export ABC transporter ATP-binding protein [Candidatus Omnitrophota bacterium]
MQFEGRNLVKSLGRKPIVKDISLKVSKGEIVGLLGPNGAGKTTTFRLMVGLYKPDKGDIYLGGHNISNLPLYLRARKGLGYLPQDSSIFRKMTVEENFNAILEFLPISKEDKQKKMESTLEEMGLTIIKDSLSYFLSGGERRKVEIGRILLLSPYFLLLDEPFTGIDPLGIQDIQNILNSLKEKGIGILITDHNVKDTLKITDRAYLISSGKITCEGTPKELLNNPTARKLYFGESFNM